MTTTANKPARQPGDIGWRTDRQNPGKHNIFGPTEVIKPGEVVTVTSRDGRKSQVLVQRVSKPFVDEETSEEVCFGYLDDARTLSEDATAEVVEASGCCPTCGQMTPAQVQTEMDEYEEPF